MKTSLLLILVPLIGIFGNAQNDKSHIDQMIEKQLVQLQGEGIDNWIVAWRYCHGEVDMIKMPDGSLCISQGSYYEAYLLWESDMNAWIRKFDNCGAFRAQELLDNKPLTYLREHQEQLLAEEIRLYKSANYTGQPELRSDPESCFRIFDLKVADRAWSREYNLYVMSTSEKEPNVHYAHNTGTRLHQLDKLLDNYIEHYKSKSRRSR